jgi:membrane protease YdiL (CAAX protease family)
MKNERLLMTSRTTPLQRGLWARLPILLRAIVLGLLIALVPANAWPVFLVKLGAVGGAIAETLFLVLYVWWASGGGPPRSAQAARATAFRLGTASPALWSWGLIGALCFAVTVHAAIVLLFRIVAFPMAAFRHGYDLSFIPSLPLQWLAVVISATSAGVCEETGFRGYMQGALEQRYGTAIAIFVSSLFFMLLHLTKAWATPAMVPIVFGAGVLLGLLASSARSLIPVMIGHVLMDIGLFAYWWTGIAGNFTARPISETGVDGPFLIASVTFGGALFIVLLAISRLRKTDRSIEQKRQRGAAAV